MRPGERLAADGIVLDGISQIDEAMITGESMPVEKGAGAEVISGTINKAGAFTYRATGIGADTVLHRIVQLVEQAQNDKPEIQRIADKIASIFVPVVMLVAVLTFAVWMAFGDPARTQLCLCHSGVGAPDCLPLCHGFGDTNGYYGWHGAWGGERHSHSQW